MGIKLVVAAAILLVSIPSLAQVEPQATAGRKFPVNWSVGGGMDYFSGDWGTGDINRWGPSVWATSRFWHCLGTNVEGHSMIIGGNQLASKYKLFVGEGGAMCTMGYWGRFQPIFKGEVGFASLSQPGNGSGHLHSTYGTWSVGGGAEYHTAGQLVDARGLYLRSHPEFSQQHHQPEPHSGSARRILWRDLPFRLSGNPFLTRLAL